MLNLPYIRSRRESLDLSLADAASWQANSPKPAPCRSHRNAVTDDDRFPGRVPARDRR